MSDNFRNKLCSFNEKTLRARLESTNVRIASLAGKRVVEVLKAEVVDILDVLSEGDFAPPGGTYAAEHVKKLASKEFRDRQTAKLAG